MKHRNPPKLGPGKAFYKDEMGEQTDWWSSLKVVKSSCTEIRLSGGLCNLRKVILMGINGIGRRELEDESLSVQLAIDAGPAW